MTSQHLPDCEVDGSAICSHCQGDGGLYHDGEFLWCPYCGGTGRIPCLGCEPLAANVNYQEAADKLATFFQLRENWDSYGARKIDDWCIARAAAVLLQWGYLPIVEVTPMSNGGILIGFAGPPCMEITIEPKDMP